MKILIAVDGSESSDVAVEEVAKRSWPADSAVRIISVAEILPLEILSGPPWLERAPLGSVSQAVAAQANCSNQR